jgi:histidinol-phosphatase
LATNGHLHDAALSFLGSMDDDGDADWRPTGPGSVSELRPRGPRASEDEPEPDPES